MIVIMALYEKLIEIQLIIHEAYHDKEITEEEYDILLCEYTQRETIATIECYPDLYLEKSGRNDNIDSIADFEKTIEDRINEIINWMKSHELCGLSSKYGHMVDVTIPDGQNKIIAALKHEYDICSKYLKWAKDWNSSVYTAPKGKIDNDMKNKLDKITLKYEDSIKFERERLEKNNKKIKDMSKSFGGYVNDPRTDNDINTLMKELKFIASNTKKNIMSIQRQINKVIVSKAEKTTNDSKSKPVPNVTRQRPHRQISYAH